MKQLSKKSRKTCLLAGYLRGTDKLLGFFQSVLLHCNFKLCLTERLSPFVTSPLNKVLLISSGLLFLGIVVKGQDVQFTQYHYTPYLINPAQNNARPFARIMLNHRTQQMIGNLQMKSTLASASYPLINRKSQANWADVGLMVMHDRFLDYKFQGGALSFTWHLPLDDTKTLSIGGQGGYFRKKLNLQDFQTGSQYVVNYGYDPSVALGENLKKASADYMDISTGLRFIQDTDGNYFPEFMAGLAVYRINRPLESFLANDVPLPVRYVFTAGKQVFQNKRWIIIPETRWIYQQNQDFISGGARINYLFDNENPLDPIARGSIEMQAQYRYQQSIAFGIRFNQPDFSVGFSYDVGATNHPGPLQGATEFAIGFRKRITRKRKEKRIDNYSIGEVRRFYDRQQTLEMIPEPDTTMVDEPETSPIEDSLVKSNENINVRFELAKSFQFAFNKAKLTRKAKLYLDKFYQLMVKNPDLRLRVTGHTDNIGTEKANLELSLRRARSVTGYLQDKGISPDRLKAEGKGENEPLVANDSAANRAKNRRVEFVIFSGG